MNSLQLTSILQSDLFTNNCFKGVFASDTIPQNFNSYPCTFILNTDPHTKPGSHWLAVYMNSFDDVEFFDSYAHTPSYFSGAIQQYFKRFSTVTYNDVPLQSDKTAVCGQYCVYYVYHRCRKKSLKQIVKHFDSNLLCNDIRVYNFIKKKFHVHVPFFE